ncbi:MAG: hypothetical protein WCF85_15790 [Rhodospirillaceae bacterium]
MRYGLTDTTHKLFVEISEDEFKNIKYAVSGLLKILQLETVYDIVIDNYIEFEIELMKLATYGSVRRYTTNIEFREIAISIDRRLINIMTSGKMFKDFSTKGLIDKNIVQQKICASFDSRRCQISEYRIFEMLRNYAQHSSLPISGLTVGGKWELDEDGKKKYNCYKISPRIDAEVIKNDINSVNNKNDKDVLREMTGSYDVKQLVRGYVDTLAIIRSEIRATVTDSVEAWETEYNETIRRVPEISACAVIENDDGAWDEQIGLCKDMIEMRKMLESKNSKSINLLHSYVSSII